MCLNDCPIRYQYYTENTKTNLDNTIDIFYECQNICEGYYVPNEDINKIAKHYLNNCPDTDYSEYKYIFINSIYFVELLIYMNY